MSKSDYWKYYRDFDVPCANLSVCPKCVRLMDWEYFISVAYEPLRINYDLMHKRYKIDESVKLYDYVMEVLMKQSEERGLGKEFGIVIMAQIFSIAYRLPVEPMALKKDGVISIVFRVGDNDEDLITKDNYEEIRERIMEQNLIFEPIVAPNKKSQDAIDKAIARKRDMGSNIETNIESMIVLVSKSREVTEDYTYYQLQADYEMELRLEQSRAIPTYRAVGADIDDIQLGQILSMHEDPYSFDKMFKKNDRTKDKTSLSST